MPLTKVHHPLLWALFLLATVAAAPPLRAQTPNPADDALFTRVPDVIYGEKTGLNGEKLGLMLVMDVFKPKQNAKGRGIVFVVSGGWYSSRANMLPALPRAFVQRGYTVFAVVHGTQPRFNLQEIVQDMNRSVRFIRYHAKEYGIDPDKIGIYGGSAGGHLSLMQGTGGDLGNPKSNDPVDQTSSRVQAVACFFPPTDFLNYGKEGEEALGNGVLKNFAAPFQFIGFNATTKRYEPVTDHEKIRAIGRTVSPISHVSSDDPPTLIIHGDADLLVPIQQAQVFVDKMKQVGAKAELIVKPGAKHGWGGMNVDQEKMADWFDTHLK